MPLLRDLWDMSIPGQRMNEARAMREQRALAAQQMEMEAAKAQAEQMQQQSSMQREAGLRAAKAVRAVAPRFGNDYAAAFDFVAGKSGGLFGSPEELSAIRGLVAEGGPEALDAIEAAFGAPQKPTNRFMAVGGKNIFDTQNEQFLTAPGGEDGMGDLDRQYRMSQIDANRALAEQRRAKGGAPAIAVAATPGRKKVDEKYADRYLSWREQGGASALGNIDRIDTVIDALANEENITGPIVGLTDPKIRSLYAQKSADVQQTLEEVVQQSLRAILGGQFAMKEGQELVARAYNPRLSQEQNLQRVQRLKAVISAAAQAKEDQARYFEENGTLAGWQGKVPDITSLRQQLDAALKSPAEGAAGSEDDAALLAKYGIQ